MPAREGLCRFYLAANVERFYKIIFDFSAFSYVSTKHPNSQNTQETCWAQQALFLSTGCGTREEGHFAEACLRQLTTGPPPALGPLHLLLCTFHLQQWLRVGNGDEALENAQVAVTYEKPDRRGAYIGERVKGSRLSPELPPLKPESWQDESWS